MLSRIIVAIIGIPILVGILYFGGLPLLLFTNIIVGIGSYEFYKMVEASGRKPYSKLGILLSLVVPNAIYMGIDVLAILVFCTLLLITIRVLNVEVENSSIDIGTTLLGIIYVGCLFSHVLLINNLENGGKWLLTAQIMVWVCDSFAYFIGMSIGRKFFSRGFNPISPKKSIEGSIGGTICTVITLYLLDKLFSLVAGGLGVINILILGIFISLVAQIGDLGESMFKREFKIKDSGTLLKGHGGILDRFDSMLFVAPVMYYLLKYIVL